MEQACRLFIHALEQGNEDQCLGVAPDLRPAGHDMAAIADRLIAQAIRDLGPRVLWLSVSSLADVNDVVCN